MRKVEVPDTYPPEEGCYLRGNDYSSVAVVVILNRRREETPPELEALVRCGVESGAALAGTLQTENIGIEKIVCNIVANPNIRYIVLCGPESPGHLTGEALKALVENGLDERKKIKGTKSPTPYLYNIPEEFVERFRRQISIIDLLFEGRLEVIREAVWSCYQEEPTQFKSYTLYDPGAYEGEPLIGKITWKVANPAYEPKSDEEREQVQKMRELMERIQKRNEERRSQE